MVNGFLDWFEEHKFGVIGTLAVHSMLLFIFTLMSIRTGTVSEPMVEMNMEVLTPEEIQRLDEQSGQEVNGPTTQVTNASSNVTARSGMHAYSPQRLAERVETDLREFERAEFDRLAQERRDRGEEVIMPELDPSKWNKEQYMDKATEPVKVEGATTVWYDLEGRVRENDVPGYLCHREGRVAIAISVDAGGNVVRADLDEGRSANVDECMLEHALRSARRARFNASGSAPDPQKGTLFFLFLSQ